MNKLWHFGDSWSKCSSEENIFSHYIAKYYEIELKHFGQGGTGNFEIFYNIIKNDTEYKLGDLILINWSYFSRPTLTEIDGGLIGVDNLFKLFPEKTIKSKIDENAKNFLMDWVNDWNFIDQYKLFRYIIFPYIRGLEKRGIKIKMVFLEQHFPINTFKSLYYNKIGIQDKIITDIFSKWVLHFHPFYLSYIDKLGWAKQESGHYTFGIQEQLAEKYIKRIEE